MSKGPIHDADPRNLPNYTTVEAARWLGLVPATVRTWLVGQRYRTSAGRRYAPPVLRPAQREPLGLSFWNLVECSVLAAMRKRHRVSFQKVRRSLLFVSEELQIARPLIEKQFRTDGVHLFVKHYGKLIAVSQYGQLAFRELLEASLTRIDCDEKGLAARLFPWTHRPTDDKVVAIDPRVSFGRPVLFETAIPVETILGRFRAGETIEHLAEDYRVSKDRIESVVRWAFVEPAAA